MSTQESLVTLPTHFLEQLYQTSAPSPLPLPPPLQHSLLSSSKERCSLPRNRSWVEFFTCRPKNQHLKPSFSFSYQKKTRSSTTTPNPRPHLEVTSINSPLIWFCRFSHRTASSLNLQKVFQRCSSGVEGEGGETTEITESLSNQYHLPPPPPLTGSTPTPWFFHSPLTLLPSVFLCKEPLSLSPPRTPKYQIPRTLPHRVLVSSDHFSSSDRFNHSFYKKSILVWKQFLSVFLSPWRFLSFFLTHALIIHHVRRVNHHQLSSLNIRCCTELQLSSSFWIGPRASCQLKVNKPNAELFLTNLLLFLTNCRQVPLKEPTTISSTFRRNIALDPHPHLRPEGVWLVPWSSYTNLLSHCSSNGPVSPSQTSGPTPDWNPSNPCLQWPFFPFIFPISVLLHCRTKYWRAQRTEKSFLNPPDTPPNIFV